LLGPILRSLCALGIPAAQHPCVFCLENSELCCCDSDFLTPIHLRIRFRAVLFLKCLLEVLQYHCTFFLHSLNSLTHSLTCICLSLLEPSQSLDLLALISAVCVCLSVYVMLQLAQSRLYLKSHLNTPHFPRVRVFPWESVAACSISTALARGGAWGARQSLQHSLWIPPS
jgi:hypothetical protein